VQYAADYCVTKLPAFGLFLYRALLDPNKLLTLDCSTLTTGSAYFFVQFVASAFQVTLLKVD